MKTLVLSLVVLAFAVSVNAAEPTSGVAPEEVPLPPLGLEFYCQEPHVYLQTINASTAFESEIADDIPDDFYCTNINDVVFYVAEWGAGWVDPAGVYVNFYNAECPPGQDPYLSFYFTWAEVEAEQVYSSSTFNCFRVQVYLPELVHIEYDLSIGFVVDTPWGQTVPYAGITMTNDYDVYGDCMAYWSPEYWGYPRWTAVADYFGTSWDVAYCLSSPTEGGGDLIFMDCYLDGGLITGYFFSVYAENLPVNDVEVCTFIDDLPAPVWSCSVPGSWYCHFDPGSNCVYYFTYDNPIPAGETYGPFDVWIDPPYCYLTLTVIWTLTLDGEVVAGPETTYWDCGPSDVQGATWGSIKSLYR